jgi:DedD protein
MNPQLKQRLVGAAVIIACAVIFIPMLVDEDALQDTLDRDRFDVLAPEPDSATPITPMDEHLVEQTERAARGASRDPEPISVGQDQASPTDVIAIPARPLSQPETTPTPDVGRQTVSRTAPTSDKDSTDLASRPSTTGATSARPGPTPPVATRAEPAPAAEPQAVVRRGAWAVQLGSFSSEASARVIERRVRDAGYPAFVDTVRSAGGATTYRVRVGPELLRANAETTRAQLQQLLKINGIVMPHP